MYTYIDTTEYDAYFQANEQRLFPLFNSHCIFYVDVFKNAHHILEERLLFIDNATIIRRQYLDDRRR